MTADVRPEAAFYPATTGRTGGYGLGGTGLHDAGRPVSLPFRIQQPRYQRAIPLALHCAKELSHSAAPQQQHLLPELQRAATRDHSGGPCPAGSFGGMFPRRSAEAGPRGLQSLFSAMVKRPNCKRQIVEDEFIRAGRDVSPAGPGDSAVVCTACRSTPGCGSGGWNGRQSSAGLLPQCSGGAKEPMMKYYVRPACLVGGALFSSAGVSKAADQQGHQKRPTSTSKPPQTVRTAPRGVHVGKSKVLSGVVQRERRHSSF